MAPFGILGIVGDQFYLKGIHNKDLLALTIAKNIFPFEREILIGPAHLYLNSQIVTLEAKNEVEFALKYDPYSVQLLGVYIQYAIAFKDIKYREFLSRLKLISPNSQMTKIVSDKLKESYSN